MRWDGLTYSERYALIKRRSTHLITNKDGYEIFFLRPNYFIFTNLRVQDIMAIGRNENPDLFAEIYSALYYGIGLRRAFIHDLRQRILVVETVNFPLF